MTTTITNDIIAAIKASSNIMICGHIRPDGDCVSSALAMRRICESLGKNAVAVCDADKPEAFAFLPDYDKFCVVPNVRYDLFIAVDCAALKRLGEYLSVFNGADRTIDIDHHPTNEGYADINYIYPEAASTTSIIFALFKDSGLIDADIAKMLYTGLSTDTGHFMHANTDQRVFRTASELCAYGLDVGTINHDIYCNKSVKKMRLTARAIGNIKLYAEGRIGVMTLSSDDLAECGCTSEDTEGLIDFVREISGVQISISLCEQKPGWFRISFRALKADVASVAAQFGGGGHKLASGCIMSGSVYDVTNTVVAASSRALSDL